MTAVILFVFGTIVGSFLNVVGLRWDNKNFGGRSACPHCHKTLVWWELIPIISFFLLRRKCSQCGEKISWQYPLVEILTGLVFATIYNLQFTIYQNLIFLVVFCIYIVIAIYDTKYKIIPDELVYTAIFLGGLYALLNYGNYGLLDYLAGPIIFTFFGAIWLFSRGRAMGFGDAKLGLSIGLLLGAAHAFSGIVLSFWIGTVVTLLYIFAAKYGFLKDDKHLTIKSEIPFAPFIIIGTWLGVILDLNILHASAF